MLFKFLAKEVCLGCLDGASTETHCGLCGDRGPDPCSACDVATSPSSTEAIVPTLAHLCPRPCAALIVTPAAYKGPVVCMKCGEVFMVSAMTDVAS
jgi:hypothetical protein